MSVQAVVLFNFPGLFVVGNVPIIDGKQGDRVVSVQMFSSNTTVQDVTSQFAATLPSDGNIDCIDVAGFPSNAVFHVVLARGV